ncbi:MAG: S53 family peptidase [Steroidobacteraceae bacterium]
MATIPRRPKRQRTSRATATTPAARHPYVHRHLIHRPYVKRPRPGARRDRAWEVPALCTAYDWPTGLEGGGVIAIVELGGGWLQSDLDAFFKRVGQRAATVTDVSVGGVTNSPGKDLDSDTEVALDIEVAAAAYSVATGHPAVIRIYWANDIAPGVQAAAADGCDVCSISWGSDEANWGEAAGEQMEQVAAAAADKGMLVFAASGDNDSSDGGSNPANVDLPASCPHVIGCGGTSKTAEGETVWNNDPGSASGEGTGGGFSTIFQPVPSWQVGAPNGPGRMVPDVAGNADPNTGYNMVVDGAVQMVGGTSAVAPLYSGLFASFGRKLGWVTPELWQNQVCFNDITQGDNGAYRARPGPDPCTGLGSPIGNKLATLLTDPRAGQARLIKQLVAQNRRLREQLARRGTNNGA